MNTQDDYIKGEEGLTNWVPRGVSLIRDHIAAKRRKIRLAEIEQAQPLLNRISFPSIHTPTESSLPENSDPQALSQRAQNLAEKYIALWKQFQDPTLRILTPANVEPPSNGVPQTPPADTERSPNLLATISLVPKNTTILKGGYLLTPSLDSSRWVRRFVELRRPYLYVHSVPDGEEVFIVSLRNSRVDHQPQIARLLKRDPANERGRAGDRGDEDRVFAVYGTDNTWLFKARSEREKVDWIFKIDQSYFGGSGSGSEEEI